MFPYIRLGSYLLQTSGLSLLIGVSVGLTLVEKEAIRLKLKAEPVYNLVFFGLIAGLLGARLTYAASYLNVYLENPSNLFDLNLNTLSLNGGLVIGAVVAILYGMRNKLPLRPTLDALTLGLGIFLVFLGLSNFFSGNAFGEPSEVPWAIYLWEEYRHPTQIYETLAALGVFALVWKRPFGLRGNGVNFTVLVALTAASRLFFEAFRGDSIIWAGGFRIIQVVSLAILLASLGTMIAWMQANKLSKKR